MMNSIVAEKLISFKELEQKVFKYICELGCEITRIMLESYDRELATTRDTKQYRDNKELIKTIDRYTDGLIFTMQMQEIVETLSAAKAPKKDGKGNSYVEVVNAHMPIIDAMQTASRKAFRRAFG